MKTKYIIYKITNNVDGKIYIGAHKTKNVNDNYMGSGKYLKRAQNKHGLENFSKEILETFENSEDMFKMESLVVNADFIKDKSNYNLKEGGFGGFEHIIKNRSKCEKLKYSKNAKAVHTEMYQESKEKSQEYYDKKILPALINKYGEEAKQIFSRLGQNKSKEMYPKGTFFNHKHSDDAKKRIGKANSKHQTGKGNSQYGKMWIFNNNIKQNKKINKEDKIPSGWKKGRKMFK